MAEGLHLPTLFVGSSSEGVEFARAVRAALEHDAEVTVWDEGVFEAGQTYVENLTQALDRFDFAVLVLTPDDVVQSKSADASSPRDNVIFELGLFMGRLGRGRTFILQPSGLGLKIPSDLSGVVTASYVWPRADTNYKAAVATASDEIRKRIRSLGKRDKRGKDESLSGLDFTRVRENNGILSTTVRGCEIRVTNGRIEEHGLESAVAVVLPCNEYFDDRCAYDPASALGAYVKRVFDGEIDEFISFSKAECKKRFGAGVQQQKTDDEFAQSFGAGRALLLLNPLGRPVPIGLVSTTTQRASQGLAARTSYLFDGICELVTRLVDARLREVVMPILGAGHGGIHPAAAFVSLLLALAESARYAPSGKPLKSATVIVFQKDANSPPQVDPVVVRRALALIGSVDP